MSLTLIVSAAWLSAATVAQAGPVQTYSNAIDPSRSEGLFTNREYVPRADPRPDHLLNPAPYPTSRTDDPARQELGRLWVSRHPVGNRTPLSEDTRVQDGGPANFGAPPEALDAVIYVKSARRGIPIIAISPWQRLDADLTDEIRRDNPWMGSVLRGRTLLRELKQSQRRWLDEQGYILHVRTHVSPRRIYGPASRPVSDIEPRGIIRVRPAPLPKNKLHVQAGDEMRISVPAHAQAPTPVRVVRASENETES